jgi:hypothetical protein
MRIGTKVVVQKRKTVHENMGDEFLIKQYLPRACKDVSIELETGLIAIQ